MNKEEPLSWSESQAFVPQLALRRVLAFAFGSGSSAERYFTGWLTEVGNGSAKRKGRIERQFSPSPIEGFWKTNVSKLFSRCDFFYVERNSEEFSVILGILRNRSERSGSLRCRQELMEFPIKGWRKHSV